jgi:hypothetical protein
LVGLSKSFTYWNLERTPAPRALAHSNSASTCCLSNNRFRVFLSLES